MEKRENSEQIPFDLIIKIFTRLPAKSIARFRCVSKLCSSTFRSPYFTDSFFTISSSQRKLLFASPMLDGTTYFFSSPSPSTTSQYLSADCHMRFSIKCTLSDMSRPVNGLVCGFNQETLNGERVTSHLICNPSMGQFITLPKVKTGMKRVISYFGYDPVHKEFKVLCMTQLKEEISRVEFAMSQDHQILTLGKLSLDWRMVECDVPHYPVHADTRLCEAKDDGVCINGVMYYLVVFREGIDLLLGVASFDIRSEKFRSIKKDQDMDIYSVSSLVNYKGKLASIHYCVDVFGIYESFYVWVLEDVDKHQWSQHVYDLPPSWMYTVRAGAKLRVVGMTSIGEIVLSTGYIANSFYLIYYNPESNTVAKFEIRGMGAFKYKQVYTFLDHLEDVKLMESV